MINLKSTIQIIISVLPLVSIAYFLLLDEMLPESAFPIESAFVYAWTICSLLLIIGSIRFCFFIWNGCELNNWRDYETKRKFHRQIRTKHQLIKIWDSIVVYYYELHSNQHSYNSGIWNDRRKHESEYENKVGYKTGS